MTRLARIVVPGYPHHIIQRGTRGMPVFFCDSDREIYLELLSKHGRLYGIQYWAYCLMSNHVHLIAVPLTEKSLAKGLGEAHKAYTHHVNGREGWKGYLWQGRFLSYPMNEKYLYAAVRYVELNPVHAGVVEKAEDYLWSSARFHVLGEKDSLISDHFMTTEIKNWAEYLGENFDDSEEKLYKKHANSGRPLGDDQLVIRLERITGRFLRKKKTGPKPTGHSAEKRRSMTSVT